MSVESPQASAKRVAAERARWLARGLAEEDRVRVLAFADELDAQAEALECGPIAVPPITEPSQPARPVEEKPIEKKCEP